MGASVSFRCQFLLDRARLHERLSGFYLAFAVSAKASAPPVSLRQRTAIVMPIYNEAPARIFAALEAMIEEVEASGLGQRIRMVLSVRYHRSGNFRRRGARVSRHAGAGLAKPCRLFYRHRPQEPQSQVRQYRGVRHPLGRPLRAYGGPRRRQFDDRAAPSSRLPPPWKQTPTRASFKHSRSSSTATRYLPASSNSRHASMGR